MKMEARASLCRDPRSGASLRWAGEGACPHVSFVGTKHGVLARASDRNLPVIQQAVAYYLGIDGGGTKTTCLLGDEASILGRGDASGSNVVRLGEQSAREALQQAVRGACEDAKIDPARLTRTVAGVAGAGRAEVRGFLRQSLREVVDCEIVVVTDVEAALHAAFGDG